MPSVAEWDNNYRKCIEVISTTRSMIQSGSTVQDLSRINSSLDNLKRSIGKLNDDLTVMAEESLKYKLTDREISKRHKQLESLDREHNTLTILSKQRGQSVLNPKSALLQKQNGSAPTSSEFDNKTNEQIKQEQKLMMKQQDANLQILLDATNQTHQVALQINDTTKQQNNLLENLLNSTDKAEAQLNANRQKINIVSNQSNYCSYYMVILVLFIILMILVYLFFKK